MPIKIDALVENPSLIDRLGCASPICPICKKDITGSDVAEARDMNTYYKNKLAHTDCYYGSLGEAVEEHPIASGRVRRG